MKRPSLALAVLLAGQVAAYAPQQEGSAPLEPAAEARVQKLGKELRCAVCQGLSIADSPASMARAQLDKVRELVAAGKSDDEIRDYFVARYGEWVLLSPAAQGFNWLVWLGPAALIAGGFIVIFNQIRKRTSAAASAPLHDAPVATGSSPAASGTPEPALNTAAETTDEYLQRVRSELEG